MQERRSIYWHSGENGTNDIADNGYPSLIRSVDIVPIVFVRDNRSFRNVNVHVLEGVSTVTQIEEHGLVSVLRKTVRLKKTKKANKIGREKTP